MAQPRGITRVVLVILDGLRADAVPLFSLSAIRALAERSARTFAARTVDPSITAAAITSLCTGVPPEVHGVRSDRFAVPRRGLTPLPGHLRAHGFPVRAFMAAIPRPYRGLAVRIAGHLGLELHAGGNGSDDVLASALPTLARERRGVWVLHWPDADRVGHEQGWTSLAYAAATRRLDRTLERLLAATMLLDDPATLLVVCADHGGGGVDRRDHNSRHPLDTTIPLIVAGHGVTAGDLAPGTTLLDVPSTILWALGVPSPGGYQGRPLVEAFRSGAPDAVETVA